jgi:hypothetical protein
MPPSPEYKLADLLAPDVRCSDWMLGPGPAERQHFIRGDRIKVAGKEYEVVFSGRYQKAKVKEVNNG